MPNAYLPRETVHAWSEQIGEDALNSQASLNRLLRDQKRLTKFIQENAESLTPATSGVTMYLTGVIIRLFDLAGGRLRSATWAQIREASSRVNAVMADLLPVDGFPERVRQVEWRAQPHILDEALMALFEREPDEEEQALAKEEALKVFLLLWVFTEVLDSNWRPASSFTGLTEYTYVHIEPEKKEDAEA